MTDVNTYTNAQCVTSAAIPFSNVLDRKPVMMGSSKKCLQHNPNNCNGFLLVGNQLDFYKKFKENWPCPIVNDRLDSWLVDYDVSKKFELIHGITKGFVVPSDIKCNPLPLG